MVFQGLIIIFSILYLFIQWNKTELRLDRLERYYPLYPSKTFFLRDIEVTMICFNPMRFEYEMVVYFLDENKKPDRKVIITHMSTAKIKKVCNLLSKQNIKNSLQQGFRFD